MGKDFKGKPRKSLTKNVILGLHISSLWKNEIYVEDDTKSYSFGK